MDKLGMWGWPWARHWVLERRPLQSAARAVHQGRVLGGWSRRASGGGRGGRDLVLQQQLWGMRTSHWGQGKQLGQLEQLQTSFQAQCAGWRGRW